MIRDADLSLLVDEYRTMLRESHSPESTEQWLRTWGEWTPDAAEVLTVLATAYGSVILRNAAALAIAMGIEDGSLGY